MMTSQPQPLERAAKVLTLKTLLEINRTPSLNRFGMNILDRWAMNQPEELKALEMRGLTLLLIRVLGQQRKEREILDQPENQARLANGLTPHEILEEMEIPTSL